MLNNDRSLDLLVGHQGEVTSNISYAKIDTGPIAADVHIMEN